MSNLLDFLTRTQDEKNSLTLNGVYTAGEGITSGMVVYLKLSDQKVYMAKANSAATMPCIGLAVQTVVTGEKVTVQNSGVFSGIVGTITAGAAVYVSPTTAGNLTGTQLTTAGQIEQVIGRANSTTAITIELGPQTIVTGS